MSVDEVNEPFMTHSFAYLEAMGITQWQLRHSSDPELLSQDSQNQSTQTKDGSEQHTYSSVDSKTRDMNSLVSSERLSANSGSVQSEPMQSEPMQSDSEQAGLEGAGSEPTGTQQIEPKPTVAEQSVAKNAHQPAKNARQAESNAHQLTSAAHTTRSDLQVAEATAEFSITEADSTAKSGSTTSTANLSEQEGQRFMVLGRGKQWKNDALTVLCRHETGQPSESYLLRGNPSKIVQNMLKALNFFMHHEVATQVLQQCNLAQLASTSLSEQAKAAKDVFAEHKPKAMLVMGAATANHLMGYEQSMGQWQVKTWQTKEGIPFVVTYHPFEIHSSPILKRQVMSDLLSLTPFLSDD